MGFLSATLTSKRRKTMKKILIAHDGSKSSDKALKRGLEIAERFDSAVTVMTVIPSLYLTELMETDREKILRTLSEDAEKMMAKIKAGPRNISSLKTVIKQGSPADEILKAAEKMKADMIVTGSHGRHGAQKFLLGSVSSKIIDHASCNVLVVKN
jgi:nucleotide-binding universal stress UspA family protein